MTEVSAKKPSDVPTNASAEAETQPHINKDFQTALLDVMRFLDVTTTQGFTLAALQANPEARTALEIARKELKLAVFKEMSMLHDPNEIARFFMDKLVVPLHRYSPALVQFLLIEDILPTYQALVQRRTVATTIPTPV